MMDGIVAKPESRFLHLRIRYSPALLISIGFDLTNTILLVVCSHVSAR